MLPTAASAAAAAAPSPTVIGTLTVRCRATRRLLNGQFSFQASFFLGGGRNFPHTYNSPQTAAKLCTVNFFSAGTMIYKYITKNFLLTDNKHRNLFISNLKDANLCLNAAKYVWRPGSARTRWGSLCAPPDLLAAIGSTFKGRKGGKKKGSTYKGS